MHSFAVKAPMAEQLLSGNTLNEFINKAGALSREPEVIDVYEVGGYKGTEDIVGAAFNTTWSPAYFGSAIEFLAECFFEVFGPEFNLQFDYSVDDFDNAETDKGIDHYAKSLYRKRVDITRETLIDSPVYIQTKGTTNRQKMFKTNDGARLPNFFMASMAEAIKGGTAYQSRYILFTTGKGIHYRLEDSSGKMCEVINYNKISKRIDGNVPFWNKMRDKMDAPLQHFEQQMDTECQLIIGSE